MDSKYNILYVDDEDVNLFLFEKIFEKDFSITAVSSGKQGLLVLKNKPNINLVISDMKMPYMDGLEFIDEAKKISEAIPYFILTAYEVNPELRRAILNGVIKDVFRKPMDYDTIKNAIDNELFMIGDRT